MKNALRAALAMLRALLPAACLLSAGAPTHAQNAYPYRSAPLAATDLRGDMTNAYTEFAGPTAPTPNSLVSPAVPLPWQRWINTGASAPTEWMNFTGAASGWGQIGTLDPVNKLYVAPVGRGMPQTLASAATTDLGTVPETAITITGAASITSLGTSAEPGDIKILTFSAGATLVYNATSLIIPGAANLVMDAGDIVTVEALGSGDWQVISKVRASSAAARGDLGLGSLATLGYDAPFSVSGGNLTPGTAAANTFLAGPTSGSAATGAYRPIVAQDVPTGSGLCVADALIIPCWSLVQPHTASLATLEAIPAATVTAYGYTTARRDGYATAGDGGAANYFWSATSTATADGGAVINPTGNSGAGRWLLDPATSHPTPMIWGCAGDGVTNDAVCVQAAINAIEGTGGTLYLGPHMYLLDTGVACTSPIVITGQGRFGAGASFSGFRAGTQNLVLFTGCGSSTFSDFFIDDAHAGANTSGAAIATGIVTSAIYKEIWIDGACIAIDLNGNTVTVQSVYASNGGGAGCYNIRVGYLTTLGATVDPRIFDTTLSSAAAYNLLVLDAGGLMLSGDDFLYGTYGTALTPGANQQIDWLDATGYVGDTNVTGNLYINTTASSAVIKGDLFHSAWTSSAGTGPNITILNTAGGLVADLYFDGQRAFGSGAGNMTIGAGVGRVEIDHSRLCGAATGSNIITLANSLPLFKLQNSTLSGSCSGFSTTPTNAVAFGTSDIALMTGNDLSGATNAVSGAPVGASIVQANKGLDDQVVNVATAATITLPLNHNVILTGTTSITAITGGLNDQTNTLTTRDGTVSVGGLCGSTTKSVPQYSSLTINFIPGLNCWSSS